MGAACLGIAAGACGGGPTGNSGPRLTIRGPEELAVDVHVNSDGTGTSSCTPTLTWSLVGGRTGDEVEVIDGTATWTPAYESGPPFELTFEEGIGTSVPTWITGAQPLDVTFKISSSVPFHFELEAEYRVADRKGTAHYALACLAPYSPITGRYALTSWNDEVLPYEYETGRIALGDTLDLTPGLTAITYGCETWDSDGDDVPDLSDCDWAAVEPRYDTADRIWVGAGQYLFRGEYLERQTDGTTLRLFIEMGTDQYDILEYSFIAPIRLGTWAGPRPSFSIAEDVDRMRR